MGSDDISCVPHTGPTPLDVRSPLLDSGRVVKKEYYAHGFGSDENEARERAADAAYYKLSVEPRRYENEEDVSKSGQR